MVATFYFSCNQVLLVACRTASWLRSSYLLTHSQLGLADLLDLLLVHVCTGLRTPYLYKKEEKAWYPQLSLPRQLSPLLPREHLPPSRPTLGNSKVALCLLGHKTELNLA
jgi:hypothetical protein